MSRVLIIGDTHCPGMLRGYPPFLESVAEQWQCDTFVHIGDLVDWSRISYHAKHPHLPGVKEETRAARRQVQRLAALFPECSWLLGNHDSLPARQAQDAGLPDDALKDPADYWGIDWTTHERFAHIKIDGVLYTHGETGAAGKFAHVNQSRENSQSTVIGHHHSLGGVQWTVNRKQAFFGMAVGTGMDWRKLQFRYGLRFARKPVIGCGVVIDGEHAFFERMVR